LIHRGLLSDRYWLGVGANDEGVRDGDDLVDRQAGSVRVPADRGSTLG
jgi:hypothetical protein